MKYLLLSACTLLILSYSNAQQSDLSWPNATQEAKPWTRWWWLGSAVDKANLTYNLEGLANAGIGGVEITPLYGVKGNDKNDIKFLTPEWMNMLRFTIEESNRLGMGVDMNTGTGWPFGGPQISPNEAASKLFYQKFAIKGGESLSSKIKVQDASQKGIAKLACVMAFSEDGKKLNLTDKVKTDSTLDWIAPAGNWNMIALFNGKTNQAVKRAAPGGEGKVLDHFSKNALNVYLDRFSKAFAESGCPKPHAFFNDSYEVYGADWTGAFLDEFFKRRGYRLEEYLPEFFGEGDKDLQARLKCDYRETMSDILLDNFTRPWTDWAHTMGSTNRNQAHGSPANIIDLYATVDVPECETFGSTPFDIPGLRRDSADIRQGDADPMMLKFSSSAAHLTGKKYVSSESFTWLGEHFKTAFSQCKPEFDQLMLAGVNHMYFHGTAYSPKDAVWPGWQFYASCEFNPSNTIWRDAKGFSDYVTRCQSMLQLGTADNDFVVYWPIFDMWNDEKGMELMVKIHSIQEWLHPTEFYRTITLLRTAGYDFDYITDRFIASASVVDGKVKLAGGEYKALVIPACKYMPVETLEKIMALAKAGAKVVFVGGLPGDVPGLGNLAAKREQLKKLKSAVNLTVPETGKTTEKIENGEVTLGKLSVSLFDQCDGKKEKLPETGAQYIRRKTADGYIYFISNLQAKPLNQWVNLAVGAKSAAIFEPMSGQTGIAKTVPAGNGISVYLQLEPGQSVLVKTFTDKKAEGAEWSYSQASGNSTELNGKWNLQMIAGQPEVKQPFTIEKLDTWTNLSPDMKNFAGTGKYTIKFTLPKQDADNWELKLGKVCESARVKLNGNDLGIWWSIPFKANVGKYLKAGENTLEVEVTNLAANRIAELDRQKVEWRIFKEINFVNVNYLKFDASNWKVMNSGLIGPVTLTPLKTIK